MRRSGVEVQSTATTTTPRTKPPTPPTARTSRSCVAKAELRRQLVVDLYKGEFLATNQQLAVCEYSKWFRPQIASKAPGGTNNVPVELR